MLRLFGVFVAAAALLSPGSVAAQDVQNFRPAAGTWNYFTVEGARVAKHLELIPSLVVNYARDPLVVLDGSGHKKEEIVGHLVGGDLMLTFGLLDRFELTVSGRGAYVAGEDLAGSGAGGMATAGDASEANGGFHLADLRVVPKLRLFGLEEDKGFGVALMVPVQVPVGDQSAYVGAGQVIPEPKVVLEGRGDGYAFATNVGARLRFDEDRVGTLELNHELSYGVGAGFDMGSDDVVLLTELFGATALTDVAAESHSNPLELLVGLRVFTGPGPVVTLGAGAGLVSGYGTPLYRALVGFAWHDRNYDRDGDGILDKKDSCPDDPEDKDEFEDKDGCPDTDNDHDSVPDLADACPLQAEDKDGFQDEDGCPEADNDGDNVLDGVDQCLNEPETFNGFQDEDGCPDEIPDTDGDGVKDPDDKCPMDPEDKDGFQDDDACPDPDNDGDNILDVNDKCPMDPENYNQFEDEDGCPDTKPEEGPRLVKITLKKIEILEKIFFQTNKARIKPESFEVLNQVARAMIDVPRIKLVRVEGHTDDKGRDAYNLKLSQSRAEAVRDYLVEQGVEPERLEAMGYGETRPIDTNKTAEGRGNNRRVEFVIIDQ